MAFKDSILTFSDTKIVDSSTNGEVMMSWEAPIMEKCAEFICHNKGDVLEIGFGMGICADYIQAQGVNSHTIVEIHPQIIEKLKI
jgi:protein arginine N-methyltransferase 2